MKHIDMVFVKQLADMQPVLLIRRECYQIVKRRYTVLLTLPESVTSDENFTAALFSYVKINYAKVCIATEMLYVKHIITPSFYTGLQYRVLGCRGLLKSYLKPCRITTKTV